MRQTVKSLIPMLGVALVLGGGQIASASIISEAVGYAACQNTVSDGCTADPSYVTGNGAGGTLHIIDFNNGTTNDPNGVAAYSGGTINGASQLSGNSTNYFNVNGSATITFSVAINYFGLHWGSGDSYNSVSFYNDNTLLATFSGFGGDGYASYNAVGETFNKVVLGSGGCCFETDNHAYVIAGDNAAPEPGTLSMVGTMVVGLPVYMVWRRRRYQSAAR